VIVRFIFGECEIDSDQFRLTRREEVVAVQPQVFDVLLYLINHRDRVVPKEELLDAVWGDRFVSESALTSRIKAARSAVGDDGARQDVIRTVHGRGYQFTATVDVCDTTERGADERGVRPSLPRSLSTFIGRDPEMVALSTLLGERRVVTICGSPGVGKTRLSLEVASGVAPRYADGARLVELGSIEADVDVVAHIGSELGVKDRVDADIFDRVVDSLAAQQVLILLDNCEHVSERVASLVEAIVQRTDQVDVLATSRRPLGIDGEQLWRLAPLATEGGGEGDPEAVLLFWDRMRSVAPDVTVDDEARGLVAEICRQLDGVPLLIELGAARVRHIGLAGVRASLADPAALDDSTRGGVSRHRSFDAVIRWTFDRLPEPERRLLAAVAVFPAWFDLEGVTAVAGSDGDVRPVLWRLVDESLVVADVQGPRPRYRLLAPLRAFARRELVGCGAEHEVQARHASYVLTTVTACDEQLRGPDGGAAMQRLAGLVPDIRLTHRTLVDAEGDEELAGLVSGLLIFAQEQVRSDLSALMSDALDRGRARGVPNPPVLAACGIGAWQRGDLERARRLADEALAAAGDGPERGFAHLVRGQVGELDGDLAAAMAHGRASAAIAAAAQDPVLEAMALAMCALASSHSADMASARSFAAQALQVAERASSPLARAWATYASGEVELESDPELAAPRLADAVRFSEDAGSLLLRGTALLSLVSLRSRHHQLGDGGPHLEDFAELIRHWELVGMWAHQWATLRNLVEVLARIEADEEAATLHGAATGPFAPLSAHGAEAQRLDAILAGTRQRLGFERFEELVATGARMSPSEAVATALAVTRPAGVASPTRT
jgi:predicted ATPase/DNA-binding winged helix-turn-helix (wHTH) protein